MKASEYFQWLEENEPREVGGRQYCLNLYMLAESCQATAILEVGHGWGWSATAFAASLQERRGKLVSIDPVDRRSRPCSDFMPNRCDWVFARMHSHEYAPQDTYDLIYLDGSPVLGDIGRDFDRFYPHLRNGGLLVLDGACGQAGPTAFMKESRRSWTPLQYSEYYAHAVHRKKPWSSMRPMVSVACKGCPWRMTGATEEALSEQAQRHSEKTSHQVISNQLGTTKGGLKIARYWKPAKEVA